MKKILVLLAGATLIVTGCRSTGNQTDNRTVINLKSGLDPYEVSTRNPNNQTVVNLKNGLDPYETDAGYPYPPGPPPDSVKPEY